MQIGSLLTQLTDNQWSMAKSLLTVLEAVDTVTTLLSGEKYSTLSLALPLMFGLRDSLEITKNDPTVVSTIKRRLKEQLTGRFHLDDLELGSAPVIAAATDPRFRKLSFLTDDQRKKVRDILVERASGISSCNDCPSACEPPAKKKKTALEQILGEEQEDKEGVLLLRLIPTWLSGQSSAPTILCNGGSIMQNASHDWQTLLAAIYASRQHPRLLKEFFHWLGLLLASVVVPSLQKWWMRSCSCI